MILDKLLNTTKNAIWINYLDFISSIFVRLSIEQGLVFIEVIPSYLIDIKCEAINHITGLSRHVNNGGTSKSIHSAILDAEIIASRLEEYVKPENFLFIFCEDKQSFLNFSFNFKIRENLTNACPKRHHNQGYKSYKSNAQNRAIIIHDLSETQGVKEFFRGKNEYRNGNNSSYVITLLELKDLQNSLNIKHYTQN